MTTTSELLTQVFAPFVDASHRVYLPFLLGAVVVALVVSTVLGVKVRSLFDRKLWTSASSQLDLKLWLIKRVGRVFGVFALPLSALAVAAETARALDLFAVRPVGIDVPSWLVTAAFTVSLFVAWDLSRFVLHGLMHRVPWLWRVHQLHHTADVLTPMTFYRSHPVESLLYQTRGVLVAGVTTGVFFWFFRDNVAAWQLAGVDALGFAFNLFGGNLRHSNVWLSYGAVERWLISPAQHQLHHADGHNRNFGSWLSVWDRLLGTWQPAGPQRQLVFGLGATRHSLVDALLLRKTGAIVFAIGASSVFAVFAAPSPVQAHPPPVDHVHLAPTALPNAVTPTKTRRRPDKYRSDRRKSVGKPVRLRRVTVRSRRTRRREVPGTAHEIGTKQLARFEHNDPHRAIAEAPGVYFREEDGYGLRPNIGMRGVSSERSAKITLTEDGIPIAPAPYAAPAAYYFPLVTRMSSIEVLKGSTAIRFGPNTVGGAINLVSEPVPAKRLLFADIAGGNTGYGKLHLRYGDSVKAFGTGRFGWLLEGALLRSDGFKQIDGGGDSGFFKHDLGASLRYQTSTAKTRSATFTVRFGNAEEASHETYTGLSDKDFKENPWRRYAATQNDLMTWQHNSVRLRADISASDTVDVVALAYFNDFDRDWLKLNGFSGDRSISQVLADTDAGANAVYYALLTGKGQSLGATDRVVLGNNVRRFTAKGVQLSATSEKDFSEKRSIQTQAGLRLHADKVRRLHTEQSFAVNGGKLEDVRDHGTTLDSFAFANAAAGWAQSTLKWDGLAVTAGLRAEVVATVWDDELVPSRSAEGTYSALIPGLGVLYKLGESLSLLGGVHRGFVPVAPGQQGNANPETSWNSEFGARWTSKNLHADVVGFWSEYGNLKGSCAFSSGCNPADVGTEFNGGKVRTVGVEAAVSASFRPTKTLRVPVRASYTFTMARFESAFLSNNPQWGRVEVGDFMPYLPPHQLTLQAGLGQRLWEVNAAVRYTAPMRDSAGQADDDNFTDAAYVLDLAAQFSVNKWLQLYATCNNLLDRRYVVSLRPFGARPGMPRFAVAGVKVRWK